MSSAPAVVFATPASLAEHGAAARAAWAAMRRASASVIAAASRQVRGRSISHDEMARRRLVAQKLEEMRLGADADAALGAPRLR